MDDHLRVLQERIQAIAISGNHALGQGEGLSREVQKGQEKDLDSRQDDRSIGKETNIGPVAEAQHEGIARREEGPQEKRTLLAAPESRELVSRVERDVRVFADVLDRKVV